MPQPPKSDEEIRRDLEQLSSTSLERIAQTMRDLGKASPEIQEAVTSFLLLIKDILDKRA